MLNLALKVNQFANNGQSQVFQNWQDYFSWPKESKYAILFQKGWFNPRKRVVAPPPPPPLCQKCTKNFILF